MKKIIILIICLIFSQLNHAQMTKLSTLSSAKFSDSSVIYDENKDIYGYLLLFEKNKTDKNNIIYELVLIDKNLNKVAALEYKQQIYNTMWFSFNSTIYFAKKQGDLIYFLVGQSFGSTENYIKELFQTKGVSGLAVLDLKTFTLKEGIYSNFDEIVIGNFQPDLSKPTMKLMREMEKFKLMKPINEGFLVSDLSHVSESTSFITGIPREEHQKAYNFFDFNYNKLWTLKVNENSKSKSFFDYSYLLSNSKDIVFKKVFYEKRKDKNPDITYAFIDITNGKQKFEINFSSTQEILDVEEILFRENEVVFITSIYDYNKKGTYYRDERRGIAKITLDRTTGKQISRNDLKWSGLASKLDIDEKGRIKEEGFLHFLEFKILQDGKIIAIAEGYKPEASSKILDMYAFTFSTDFKMIDFLKIDKVKNKISKIDAYGDYLESIGAFDYMYSQQLNKDNYLFFYSDNEKEGFFARKKPNWILGIVSFVDGKFETQKVQLTTKNGQIYPSIAKKGSILLFETFNDKEDKNNEMRLEKIDY